MQPASPQQKDAGAGSRFARPQLQALAVNMNEFALRFDFEDEAIIVESDGLSAWAYLIDAESGKISKDVFLYSPVAAEDTLDKSHIEQGNPPKLVKEFSSDVACKPKVNESDFSVIASGKGDYCILLNNEPLAAIYQNKQRGYSKSLVKNGGFGIPWCENKYAQVFK